MLNSMRQFKAGVFQALAHPTRVAIVEHLRHGEMSVKRISEKVGIEPTNASQHLTILRNKHIVQTRKDGNQIYYSLRDTVFGTILGALREYFLSHITETMTILREEEQGGSGEAGALEPGARPAAAKS